MSNSPIKEQFFSVNGAWAKICQQTMTLTDIQIPSLISERVWDQVSERVWERGISRIRDQVYRQVRIMK